MKEHESNTKLLLTDQQIISCENKPERLFSLLATECQKLIKTRVGDNRLRIVAQLLELLQSIGADKDIDMAIPE